MNWKPVKNHNCDAAWIASGDTATSRGVLVVTLWEKDGKGSFCVEDDEGCWLGTVNRKTIRGAKKTAERILTTGWLPRDFLWNRDYRGY